MGARCGRYTMAAHQGGPAPYPRRARGGRGGRRGARAGRLIKPWFCDHFLMSIRPAVVILAAGQGKRMHSSLPKVLHPLAGQPMLAHVIATARALNPKRICVVYGHGGEQVPKAIAAPDLVMVRQEPQLGTGHAVQQALPHLNGTGRTLVLYGDVPLLGAGTLSEMLAVEGEQLTVLTVALDPAQGYGRIVRDGSGSVTRIVEEKDASEDERRIREVNTGIMALPTARL